ncbi:MAG: IS630 family transposase [Methylococcales bacterium]|nr:IS630 family transposase [Methylococcales bacterium]
MNDYSLTDQELSDLQVLHREMTEKRQADRIKAIILLNSGWSPSQIAQVLLIDRSTVRRYYQDYKKGGVTRLLETNYARHRGYLTLEQEQTLDAYLQEHLHITAKSVIAYVEDRWDIHYSESGMTDLLHRLGYVYKKPKLIPGKADAQAQKAFLEEYEALKESRDKEDVILFMDAVHPQHNPVTSNGWIKQGKEFQICSNTGRQRLNINGAVSLDTMKLVMRYDDTINADSTINLFEQIEMANPNAKKITIICDNARYFRSKLVKAYLENSSIELMFLPPYAPNLNLIERYWKYFKKVVLYNSYYETFQQFKQACENFFENTEEHLSSLRTLLTENFQIIDGKVGYS